MFLVRKEVRSVDMSEIKTFKIEKEFKNIDDLYDYILKDVEFIGTSCGIRIENPMRECPFCIIGFEVKTKRNIFFISHTKLCQKV